MALIDDILIKIKEEITNDPRGLGYANKTDAEIMQILNSPEDKQRVEVDHLPSPINRILTKLAEAPNVITEKEVTDAKNK